MPRTCATVASTRGILAKRPNKPTYHLPKAFHRPEYGTENLIKQALKNHGIHNKGHGPYRARGRCSSFSGALRAVMVALQAAPSRRLRRARLNEVAGSEF